MLKNLKAVEALPDADARLLLGGADEADAEDDEEQDAPATGAN